jgi:hypothetical protein
LKTRFSELFRRNCWTSFEPVEGSLSVLADDIGSDKIMWTTDYLHSLSRWVIVSAAVKPIRRRGRKRRAPDLSRRARSEYYLLGGAVGCVVHGAAFVHKDVGSTLWCGND